MTLLDAQDLQGSNEVGEEHRNYLSRLKNRSALISAITTI